MRVLCVTSNFPRWAGDSTTPFVHHLCRDLGEFGCEVDVLAPHAPGAASHEVLDGISVDRFRYAWPERLETVCYQGGALINLQKRPGEKVKLPALVAAEWAAVQARLLAGEYDLLHSHWVLPQGFVGMIAASLASVPHVVTVHGGDIFALRGELLSKFKRAALRSADAITVNSSFTAARVRELVGAEPRLTSIPMGVDDSPLSAVEIALAAELRARGGGEGPQLIFVGRLVEEKGARDAIEAVDLLRAELPGVHLSIVGKGQAEAALQAEVLARQLGGHVTFLGWVDPSRIRAHLHAADVFLGPSRTAENGWVEAQGLTFLEAMAAGVPVVASRLGGIVDAVVHESSGLLVDERAPEQLAAAVLRLKREPLLGEQLIRGGKATLTRGFSRRASARAFAETFREAQRRHRERQSAS